VLLGDERGNRRSQQSRQGHRRTGRGQRIRQRSRSGHQRGWSQRRIVLAVVDDGRCRRCVVGWQPPVQRYEVSDGTEHDEPSGARSRRERLCQLADVQYGIPIRTAVGGFAWSIGKPGLDRSSATVSVTKNGVALGATWGSHRDASVMPEQQSSFMVANSNLRPASGTTDSYTYSITGATMSGTVTDISCSFHVINADAPTSVPAATPLALTQPAGSVDHFTRTWVRTRSATRRSSGSSPARCGRPTGPVRPGRQMLRSEVRRSGSVRRRSVSKTTI